MGVPPDDFVFVVNDVLEEVREQQPAFKKLQAPIDKQDAFFFVNQNSRDHIQNQLLTHSGSSPESSPML